VVLTTPTDADFIVKGKVAVAPLPAHKERVEIRWSVTNPSGDERGKVVQLNEIPAGTLDHYWGDVAVVVAAEASSGVNDVIRRQSDREPNPSGQQPKTSAPATAAPSAAPPSASPAEQGKTSTPISALPAAERGAVRPVAARALVGEQRGGIKPMVHQADGRRHETAHAAAGKPLKRVAAGAGTPDKTTGKHKAKKPAQ